MDLDTAPAPEPPGRRPEPSAAAQLALVNLEYLIDQIGESGVPAATLAGRTGLEDEHGREVVAELLAAGLVAPSDHGLVRTSTPAWFSGPTVLGRLAFADAIDNDVVLQLPVGWVPGLEVLADPEYAQDVPERLAMVLVAVALHHAGQEVTVGALREVFGTETYGGPVVLDLVRRRLLPEQPHLVAELAEYEARCRVDDVEDDMPFTVMRA